MAKFTPFADNAASMSLGQLTVENGSSRIALYGSLELTRDKAGLAQARALQELADQVVSHLEAEADLPDQLPAAASARTVKNPFS